MDGLIFMFVFWAIVGAVAVVRYMFNFACRWYDLQEKGW